MASNANAQLAIAVKLINEAKGDVDKLKKDLDDLDKKSNVVGSSFSKAGGLLKGFGGVMGDVAKIAGGFVLGQGILKAPGFLMDAAKAAAEDQAATARLHRTFQNYADMVGASEDTFERLSELLDDRIAKGQKLAFTDDQVRDSFQLLLTATDDSTEATKRQSAAMDLARGANISLETASKMLGKINEDNVNTFKKLGIELPKTATEADALAAVQARFGGQAEAYANSTAGQFERAKISIAEAKESLGAQLLPVLTTVMNFVTNTGIPAMEGLVEQVGPKVAAAIEFARPYVLALAAWWRDDALPAIQGFVDYAVPKVQEFVEFVKPKIQEFADYAGARFKEFKGYYETDIKPALENIQRLIKFVVDWTVEHWPEIERVIKPVLEQVGAMIEVTKDIIVNALQIVIDLISGDWDGAWSNVKEMIGGVRDYIFTTVNNIVEIIGLAIEGIVALAPKMLEAGKALGGALRDGFIDMLQAAGGLAVDIGKAVGNVVIDVVNGLIEKINRALEFKISNPLGPDVHINPPDIPSIPHLAAGGIVTRPTFALIGEAGPEAVVPLSRAGGAGGALGGNTYNFYIQAWDGKSVRDAIPEIVEGIRRYENGYAA